MSCRAVALALSAMPMTLALASILFAAAAEGVAHERPAAASAPAPPAQSAPPTPPPPRAASPPAASPAQQDHEAAAGGQGQQPEQGRDCPGGQRHAVEYPMVCDPVYKANTASGVGEGSAPRCKVDVVLVCKDAPARHNHVAFPILYRAGPWAAAGEARAPKAQEPEAHVPAQPEHTVRPRKPTVVVEPPTTPVKFDHEYAWVDVDHVVEVKEPEAQVPAQPDEHTAKPTVVVAAVPAEVATPAPVKFDHEYAWVDVEEVKQPMPTSASSPHRGSGRSRPSASGEWREQPRPASASVWEDVDEYQRPEPVVSTSNYGGGGSSFTSSSSSGQWEEVFVL